MKRRHFLKNSLFAAGATSLLDGTIKAENPVLAQTNHTFKLKYAPHFGMFDNSAGKDPIDQLKFMADQGFTAMEDNGMMGRTPEMQTKIGETMAKLGMTMGVFVHNFDSWPVSTSLTSGNKEWREKFIKSSHAAVEVAKRVNAKWITVVPGNFDRSLPMGIQTANVIETLRQGAAIFEPHGLVMVLEALSDTPELFLRHTDQSFMICKAVNSPSCKFLFDMYHMQRNEGNIIKNIDLVWDETGYFQIGDNPGRKEPTSGEMNYKNIFRHIYKKSKETGREFVFGMEHGNAKPGKAGEEALIKAYIESDNFEV